MGSQRVGHDWATELNWTEWDLLVFFRVYIDLIAVNLCCFPKEIFSHHFYTLVSSFCYFQMFVLSDEM